MTNVLPGFRKSPGAIAVAGATSLLFVGVLIFGAVMTGSETWRSDPGDALTSTWSILGGLYFGILLPVLITSVSAVLMNPEFQRGNIPWMKSQPGGAAYLLREKLFTLALVCATIALMQVVILVLFAALRNALTVTAFAQLVLSALLSGLGMFAVGVFYLWVSTYAKGMASTISIGIGLAVASMALAVAEQFSLGSTSIERILPSTQIISTSLVRQINSLLGAGSVVVPVAVSVAWSVLFVFLTRRRLARAGA